MKEVEENINKFEESLDNYLRYIETHKGYETVYERPFSNIVPNSEEPNINLEESLELERSVYRIFETGYKKILPEIVNNLLKALLELNIFERKNYMEKIIGIRNIDDTIDIIRDIEVKTNRKILDKNYIDILKNYKNIENLYLNLIKKLKGTNKESNYYPTYYQNLLYEDL
ncbi:hypothetical protein YN1_3160 [Nanoarchaeota archaeon]